MALHFCVNLPSTSAVHVVVMCGSSVSYSCCMCVHYSHCYAITASARQLVCVCVCVCVGVGVCVCVGVGVGGMKLYEEKKEEGGNMRFQEKDCKHGSDT